MNFPLIKKNINPYSDFGFKKLFGEEGSEDLLIDFLNGLMPEHHQIQEITFNNIEKLPDSKDSKKAFFDLFCTAKNGTKFVIEMQKGKMENFKERGLFYTTFPICESAKKGDYSFDLPLIYFIGVMDFEFGDNRTGYCEKVCLKYEDNTVYYDKLQFIMLQMPRFNLKVEELRTKMEKWMYFLKNLENIEELPQVLNMEVFSKALNKAKIANLGIEQARDYELSLASYYEVKNLVDTALSDGIKKGKAEMELVVKEAQKEKEKAQKEKEEAQKEKEEAQRKEMEAQNKLKDLVKMLVSLDVPIEQIIEKTGLTKAEVLELV